VIGPLLLVLGETVGPARPGRFLADLAAPFGWRDWISSVKPTGLGSISPSPPPLFSLLLFLLGGGLRRGWRSLIVSLLIFAGIGIVIAAMGLDHGGLPIVDTRLWGRPLGDARGVRHRHRRLDADRDCACARAAREHPADPNFLDRLHRVLAWRAADHSVVFSRTYMLPLFLPGNFTVDGLVRAPLIGIALFAGAYQAESRQGRIAGDPARAGRSGGAALGLSWWKTTALIVMPQALRHVIPGLVNSFIALFKDTSLVSIVALFDLLGQLRASFSDPVWAHADHVVHGFCLYRNDLFRLLFWHVAPIRCSSRTG